MTFRYTTVPGSICSRSVQPYCPVPYPMLNRATYPLGYVSKEDNVLELMGDEVVAPVLPGLAAQMPMRS